MRTFGGALLDKNRWTRHLHKQCGQIGHPASRGTRRVPPLSRIESIETGGVRKQSFVTFTNVRIATNFARVLWTIGVNPATQVQQA